MPTSPDPRAGLGPRARAVADWISHHAAELAVVAGTGGLGVLSPAYLALSGAVATLWGAHEWRVARHNTQAALTAMPTRELDAGEPELDAGGDDQLAHDAPIAHRGH